MRQIWYRYPTMATLHQYGVMPPRSAAEPRFQERTTISHEEFCKQAGELLLQLREPVVTEVVPQLEDYPAKWQPMGFQIYDLGIYPELGFLRLHVWPEKLRRASQKRDIIHSHPRHIASTVLTGVYRDYIFDVRPREDSESNEQAGAYMIYGKTINADQTEALVSQGGAVEAIIAEDRVIPAGSQHFIPPDVFHQTRVPLTDSCVTLAFNSFRTRADGPYVLLDQPPSPVAALREPITAEEIAGVKKMFAQ
jgi:hypothetical protein